VKSLLTFIVELRRVQSSLDRIAAAMERLSPPPASVVIEKPSLRRRTQTMAPQEHFEQLYQAELEAGGDPSAWEIGASSRPVGG
jgi:hypothetical protein